MERAFLLDNSNEFIECIRKILHSANDLERSICEAKLPERLLPRLLIV
jgi:hypothetical protein